MNDYSSLLSDFSTSSDWKFISDTYSDSKSKNEDYNEPFPPKPCDFRFIFGSFLYAVHACWNAFKGFYFR